jgi:hypothetical protein
MPTNYSDTPDSDTVEAPFCATTTQAAPPRPTTPQTPATAGVTDHARAHRPTDIGTAEIPGRGGTSKRAQPTPLRPLQDPQPQRKHQPHFGIGQ